VLHGLSRPLLYAAAAEDAGAELTHADRGDETLDQLNAAFDTYLKLPPTNRKAVFDALGAIALPPVIGDQQSKMQDLVTQALEQAANGQKSVEQALNDAATAVTALIK